MAPCFSEFLYKATRLDVVKDWKSPIFLETCHLYNVEEVPKMVPELGLSNFLKHFILSSYIILK